MCAQNKYTLYFRLYIEEENETLQGIFSIFFLFFFYIFLLSQFLYSNFYFSLFCIFFSSSHFLLVENMMKFQHFNREELKKLNYRIRIVCLISTLLSLFHQKKNWEFFRAFNFFVPFKKWSGTLKSLPKIVVCRSKQIWFISC